MKKNPWRYLAASALLALCACGGASSAKSAGGETRDAASLSASAQATTAPLNIDPNSIGQGMVLLAPSCDSNGTRSIVLAQNMLHACADAVNDTLEANQQLAHMTLHNTAGKPVGQGNYTIVADLASAPADSNVAVVTFGVSDANCAITHASASEGTVSVSWIFDDIQATGGAFTLGSYDLTVNGQQLTGKFGTGGSCPLPKTLDANALPGFDGGQCIDATLTTLMKKGVALTDANGQFTGTVVVGETADLCAAVRSNTWPTGDFHMAMTFSKKTDALGQYTIDNTSDKEGPIADLTVRLGSYYFGGSVTLDKVDTSGVSGSFDLTGDSRGEAKGIFVAAPCAISQTNAAAAAVAR